MPDEAGLGMTRFDFILKSGLPNQLLSVTFTPANGNYEGATKTVNIVISQAPLTITADNKQRGAGLASRTDPRAL